MSKVSVAVVVTTRERELLAELVRAKSTPQQLAERCRIVLFSVEGMNNEEQGNALAVDRQRVRRWRHRWARARERLAAADAKQVTDKDFRNLVLQVLTDEMRSGAPPTFSPDSTAHTAQQRCSHPGPETQSS